MGIHENCDTDICDRSKIGGMNDSAARIAIDLERVTAEIRICMLKSDAANLPTDILRTALAIIEFAHTDFVALSNAIPEGPLLDGIRQ